MNKKLRKKIEESVELKEVTNPEALGVEEIAMEFPDEYENENQFIDFQLAIAKIVIEKANEKAYEYGYNYIDVQVPETIEYHKQYPINNLSGCAIENYEEYYNANPEMPEMTDTVENAIFEGAEKAIEDNKKELKKMFKERSYK